MRLRAVPVGHGKDDAEQGDNLGKREVEQVLVDSPYIKGEPAPFFMRSKHWPRPV